jgi:cytochrome c2
MTKKILYPLLAILLLAILLVLVVRPRWYLNLTKQVEVSPATGAALVEKYECRKCHFIKGEGVYYAPNLDKSAYSDEALYGWLANPRAMRPNTAMPNLHLSDSEIQAIIAYLKSVP